MRPSVDLLKLFPRDQYDTTTKLAAGAAPAPGDLVFFGGGKDVMVDAPHTGADVRAEDFPATSGVVLQEPALRGATRPR